LKVGGLADELVVCQRVSLAFKPDLNGKLIVGWTILFMEIHYLCLEFFIQQFEDCGLLNRV
jgi:hypothetical protein